MADAGKWYKRGRRCLRGGGGGGEKERSEMGSVEQIIIKKNGGREGEIFECSGSTTRQKKTAPKSFAHFQFPPPFFKARFSLCVVWAHDVHRRRKHKTTKSPRGTNSLARRQTRTKSVCAPRPPATILRPRRGMSGSLSLSVRKQKRKKEAAW